MAVCPIMAAIAGAGVGGAVGGIAGALIGWGIPEYEAKRYENFVKGGGILISVHADDREWSARAKRVLEQSGARDVSSTSEKRSGGGPDEGGYRGDKKTTEPFVTTPYL